MKPTASGLPKTQAWYTGVTLTDYEPTLGRWLTFWFPRRMVAWPLSLEGRDGYGPKNTLTESPGWWPYFQERHKIPKCNNYWVRGHLLNDNVHGPGSKENLVPISGTLNSNMEAAAESVVKRLVKQGKVLRYVVEAHWEGCTETQYRAFVAAVTHEQGAEQAFLAAQAQAHGVGQAFPAQKPASPNLAYYALADREVTHAQTTNAVATAAWLDAKYPNRKRAKLLWPPVTWSREMLHPWAMRHICGSALVPGEQFAPTRLSWTLEECTSWKPGASRDATHHTFVPLDGSLRDPHWTNSYPV